MIELYVVIPVFNEENSIDKVLADWLDELHRTKINFRILVINDGSTDESLPRIRKQAEGSQEIDLLDKPNTGHGKSCLYGYRYAIERGAQWIFQIDSDGQCDPKFFPLFWERRQRNAAVQGYRRTREDGWLRIVATKALALTIFFVSGFNVPDPNVPYRLMHRDSLSQAIELIPEDLDLYNVFLTLVFQHRFQVVWLPINFRKRSSGQSKTNLWGMAKKFCKLIQQLLAVKARL